MTTHTIPVDHLDAARGGVLVVDGERYDPQVQVSGVTMVRPEGLTRAEMSGEYQVRAPAEFVKLTERCETCEGTGRHFIDLLTQEPGPCPDCDGSGRPWLRVDVLEYGGMSDDGPSPWKADSFRAHVLDVVPIIRNSNDWEHGHIDHIDVMGDTHIRRTPTEGFTEDTAIITLPPGDHVGRYAVLIEPESRET